MCLCLYFLKVFGAMFHATWPPHSRFCCAFYSFFLSNCWLPSSLPLRCMRAYAVVWTLMSCLVVETKQCSLGVWFVICMRAYALMWTSMWNLVVETTQCSLDVWWSNRIVRCCQRLSWPQLDSYFRRVRGSSCFCWGICPLQKTSCSRPISRCLYGSRSPPIHPSIHPSIHASIRNPSILSHASIWLEAYHNYACTCTCVYMHTINVLSIRLSLCRFFAALFFVSSQLHVSLAN